MFKKLALVTALLAPGLLLLGAALDARPALHQGALWLGLQLASLCGASLGLIACAELHAHASGARARFVFALLALCAWRVGYFPIMVFSGHAASFCEWLTRALALPTFVYPAFLLSVFVLHALWATLITHSFAPLPHKTARDENQQRAQKDARDGNELRAHAPSPRARLRWVSVPALVLALCVSFNQPRDLSPLPDTAWTLTAPEQNAPVTVQPNPYRTALFAPGYWPHQRVVLLAAALTFETIPPAPWATAVKLTLVSLFNAKPHGATRDRVREHYRAYHNAQRFLACSARESCTRAPPPPAPQKTGAR